MGPNATTEAIAANLLIDAMIHSPGLFDMRWHESVAIPGDSPPNEHVLFETE
jgi:hypothetical protein